MATRAPGQGSGREDPGCYNCGAKGHFTIACPEDTRTVPAGLEAHRQRQASGDKNGSSGNSSQSRQSGGGMVVTRYPAPPGTGPQITHYPPPPVPPPVPGPQLAHYPPPPVPPPALGPPAPYQQPPGPWPYPQPAYGASYPPPLPPPLPPPPPAATPYAPPYGRPMAPGPPPPIPPHPVPPPSHPYYPPQSQPAYYPPAPQPYPPQPYPQPAVPPPSVPPPGYQPGPPFAQPPPAVYGYGPGPAPPPLPNPVFPPPEHWTPPPGHRGNGDRNRQNRTRHGQGRKNSKHRGQQGGGRSSHEQRTLSRTESIVTTPESSTTGPNELSGPSQADQDSGDFDWALGVIFEENPTKAADAVGKPLPAEWNDDPTIPPAFNATTIASQYFNAENRNEFSHSIRDSSYWHDLRFDPPFKRRTGMVTRTFPGSEHEYFTYDLARRRDESKDPDAPSTPPRPDPDPEDLWSPRIIALDAARNPGRNGRNEGGEDVVSYLQLPSGDRQGRRYPSANLGKRNRDDSYSAGPRHPAKRPRAPADRASYEGYRPSPGRLTPNSPSTLGSPRPPRSTVTASPDKGGGSRNGRPSSCGPNDGRNSEGRRSERHADGWMGASARHDSGYHSGQSHEKQRLSRTERASPPRSGGRSESRHSDQNRSRSHSGARRRSPSFDSRSSSPLDDLELAMLGMVRPEGEDKPKKKSGSSMKKRPQKVAAAFSRRW